MGMITIDDVEIWTLTSPPNTGGGHSAPVGSIAFVIGDGVWHKVGVNNTDWSPVLIAGVPTVESIISTDFVKTSSGSISRDVDGNITSVTKSSGRTITISRDGNNNITSISDGTRTWTITRSGEQIDSWTVT